MDASFCGQSIQVSMKSSAGENELAVWKARQPSTLPDYFMDRLDESLNGQIG